MKFFILRLLILVALIPGVQYAAYARPVLTSPETQVDAILQGMPLNQKVGQLFMVSLYGEDLSSTGIAFLRDMMPGAVAMFSYNGVSAPTITQTINAWQTTTLQVGSHIPLLVAIDQEGGTVTRLTDGFTALPWGTALGAMPVGDARTVGQMAGEELGAVGVNVNLAPVVDVRTRPDNTFMEKRMWGSDPQRIGAAATAYIQGLAASGVIGVLKHFPGHGAAGDSHTMLPVVPYDRSHIDSVELVPFRTAIQGGAEMVMVGHLVYPALDPTPGLPASLSPVIVGDVLRKQLGFDGVAVTDAMDMGAIVEHFTRPVAAVMAIRAGIDLIASGPHTSIKDQLAMKQAILDAVSRGELSEARVDEAVRRVLLLKARHGLLTWSPLDPTSAEQRVNVPLHQSMLDNIYMDTVSIVQDAPHRLPLQPGGQKVALVYPGIFPSISRECGSIDKPIASATYRLSATLADESAAHTVSHDADVVIIFTYNIEDYPTQAFLVNSVPPEKAIVVALQSPYDIEHGIQPFTYVAAFNAFPASFKAVCAVLYGQHPVVGRFEVQASFTNQ